jgi:hypothetical protein
VKRICKLEQREGFIRKIGGSWDNLELLFENQGLDGNFHIELGLWVDIAKLEGLTVKR